MFINKVILRAAGATLAAVISLAAQPLGAQTPSQSDRLQKLERAVEQLQQRNAELEQEISSLKKRTAWAPEFGPGAKTRTVVAADGKSYVEKAVVEEEAPLYVLQRGPELKLVLGGFVQANYEGGDVSAFEGRFGLNAFKNRFRLRRARIYVTGEFAEHFEFKLEGDFAQGDGLNAGRTAFSATDVFVNWNQFPAAQIKIGQYKAPFGLEQLTPDTSIYIIERSLPTGAITPERQLGIQLWGKPFAALWPEQKDLLTYYAGIFNGNGRNVGNNDNNNFMYVGRLELQPFKGKVWGQESFLRLGADVLNSRDDAGVNISQAGNLLVNVDGSLSPFVLPGAAERTAWSVDAWLKLGPFDLIGEYLQERVHGRTVNGVPPGFDTFKPSGHYITAGYFLIPKKLQLATRWEDLHAGQTANSGIRSITGGLNYYIRGDDLKLMVNYIHTWSDFREANPQFGDDQFNEVIARVQLMF
jgi:phosphate-selective porin OprO/OprP